MATSVFNPSFDKDFAFLKQLHAENKEYQDMLWKKFSLVKVSSGKPRHLKHKFDSHPSGFSSESDTNNTDEVGEFFKDQPDFDSSNCSLAIQWAKQKQKSASATKMFSNETARKKLRKRITKHLRNGTIDKFDIKGIGDQLAADRLAEKEKKKLEKKKLANENDEEIKEVYVHSSKKCMVSSPSISSSSSAFSSMNPIAEKVARSPSNKKREKEAAEIIERGANKKIVRPTVILESKQKKSNPVKTKDLKKTQMAALLPELNKSRHFIDKCLSVIKDIGLILNEDSIPPDGKEDFARRKIRTIEFNSRFSRTYMYPLVRQLSSISVTTNIEKNSKDFPKLATTFQLVFQALQAYYTHLPSTVGRICYHKLREYLAYVMDVCDKSRKFFEKQPNCNNTEYTDSLRSECHFLINKIDDNFLSASVDSLLKRGNSKAVLPNARSNKNIPSKTKMKENMPNRRYAMYNDSMASRRDRQWRRMLEVVEKRKPKVKSRYRTATFKHRPPVEKQNNQMNTQFGKHRLDVRKSATSWKNTPVATPVNEDNIQTMIQFEKECYNAKDDSGNDDLEEEGEEEEKPDEEPKGKTIIQEEKELSENEERQAGDDILARLLRLAQNDHQKQYTDPDDNLTNTIKLLQQCLDIKNHNPEFFRMVSTISKPNEVSTEEKRCPIAPETKVKKRKKDLLVTVTGTKNAQLICIKDDNSIASEVDESDKNVVPQNSPRKTPNHSEEQFYRAESKKDGVVQNPSKMSIKISRINRSKRTLQLLPKQYVVNIIQNKLLFHKECKSNYMYRQTPNGKAWECLDEISDKLLDYALMGVVKEIQANELIENIYNAEFQY